MPPTSEIPAPGLYAARLVKGGPEVACAVWWRCPMHYPDDDVDPEQWCAPLDRSPLLLGMANGRWRPPLQIGTMRGLRPVDYEFWNYLLADRAWAQRWAPASAEARPYEPVDVAKIPSII